MCISVRYAAKLGSVISVQLKGLRKRNEYFFYLEDLVFYGNATQRTEVTGRGGVVF